MPEDRAPGPGASPGDVLRGVDPLPSGPDGLVCSSKGCRAAATTDLQWNNPKIHTPDRRKHWLACDEHGPTLGSFLSVRGFLRETLPLDDAAPDDAAG